MKARHKGTGDVVQWHEESLFDTTPITNETVASPAQIQEVFEFWIDQLWNGKGVRPLLSAKRERKIRDAIKLYGVSVCKQAITGCTLSDFHMGNNAQGRRYTDIELILRDPEHIERFVEYNEADEF